VPKPPLPILKTSSCVLRPLAARDLPLTLGWRNTPEIRCCFRTPDTIQMDGHKAWFNEYLTRSDDHMFIIESEGTPVGQIGLYHIADDRTDAEFGRLMIGDRKSQGRGIAKAASTMILEYAFESLGLDRLFLEVRAANEKAIRLYHRIGFKDTHTEDEFLSMEVFAEDNTKGPSSNASA